MRELLPKLAPRLPKILRTMQGLGNEGLLGLLLVAPDAPLTPGALSGLTSLGQIVVRPFGGDDDESSSTRSPAWPSSPSAWSTG